ncbi:LacI family DNA-binding transcriptional regulator [Pseudonocardia humida]|uniref:LacI family DNA-binding transcriptional regulator n=1 Tax=Pseudonocardia humida TaxID=2800819 RepID=A0ABT1A6H7_9PSEU|nr:LacI family DNA-binding transcriptional regulator [Pseudonocardia humida]MCO1658614.1 LacI family DNA-binding transcriptional regulator [Pseudonocardia humida]
MPVTIKDVAAAAGVSQSTVSRALSTPDLVNPGTRARVQAVARELGYQPNRAARGLITGRTANLGLIVPDLANPLFAAVVKGVQAAARAADYSVFIADTDEDASTEPGLLRALAKQVDGIVLCSPRSPDAELTEVGADTPVVLMNRQVPGYPAVTVDNADGMRQAVEHLAALGHRRIAYVAGPRSSWSNGQREHGLRVTTGALGVDLVHLGHFPPRFDGGVAAADLALACGATAVVAYNDIVALGLLSRLGARGVAVPDRISVLGCDDIPMSAMTHPALTTVSVPQHEAGRAAVAMLLALLADTGPVTTHRDLPTQLTVRATTGVAPDPEPGTADRSR